MNSIGDISDKLISQINETFTEFLSAKTMYELGQGQIDQIDSNVCISPLVGLDLHIEPIPIKDIKSYKENYPYFLMEVFHGKFVQLWNDYLDNIFSLFVEWHFSDVRQFKELKTRNIKLHFNSNEDLQTQIKSGIIDNFNFEESSNRQNFINKLLNPSCSNGNDDINNIYKNILIRNVIQHKNNIIDSFTIKRLGNELTILNEHGNVVSYKENDKIQLSVPEIFSFKTSMLCVCQLWRYENE